MSNVYVTLNIRPALPADAAPAHCAGRLSVLIVDGEPLIRWSLAQALEACGHRAVTAADGYAALQALTLGGLDAVVVDCRLADSQDIALLDTICALAPDLPVVAMTAFPSEEVTRRARERGVTCTLAKPFDVFSLERVLLDACAGGSWP